MKTSTARGLLLAACAVLWSGCATNMRVKPGYDFGRIRRVAVVPFEGQGGSALSHEFVRQLISSGLEVSESPKNADAVLSGSVTDYRPGNKLMVFLGNSSAVTPGGQTVVVTNPVVSISGSQVTPEGPAFGLPNTQIVSVNATVGVIARLTDAPTGTVVWVDEYSYEGIDVQSAMQAVVNSMMRSLRRVVPQARAESSAPPPWREASRPDR